MTIKPAEALEELEKIRMDLDKINQKPFKFYQGGKKRAEIQKLVDMLDVVLHSADPEYKKGDIFTKAPRPRSIRVPSFGVYDDEGQEIEASAKEWSEYLINQLDIYKKRLELLAKNNPGISANLEKTSKHSNQIFENIGTYINYNPIVNINTITKYIDQVILELDKEPNLESETKEQLKSKLQQAKNVIKNAAEEASPLAGKFVGQVIRSFLFGNDS